MDTTVDRRPYPITTAAGVTSAVTTLLSLLVTLGLIPAVDGKALSTTAGAAISAGFALGGAIVTAAAHLTAKSKTTVSADPMGEVRLPDGAKVLEPLVPVSVALALPPGQTAGEDPAVSEPGPYDHI